MELTKEQYELHTFLTNCVYSELAYPTWLRMSRRVVKRSGLRLEVFDLDEAKVVVICGTNSLKDWLTNLKIALHITPRQHKQCLQIVKEEIEKCKKTNQSLFLCGHSLGGGIAEYVLANLNKEEVSRCYGISYNGCGVKHLGGELSEDKIKNVKTKHDILNNITLNIPFAKNYMQHYSKPTEVKDKAKFALSVKSHSDFRSLMNHVEL